MGAPEYSDHNAQSGSNKLCRLIYHSHLRPDLQQGDFDAILDESVRCNTSDNITGLLVYNKTFFMQVLEGPVQPVNLLYKRLLSDSRHHSVCLVDYSYISDRRFSNWAMAVARIPTMTQRYLDQEFGGFSPPDFTAEVAEEYLEIAADLLKSQSEK